MSQANTNLDPYNRGGMWAFIFSISFSVIFFIWVSFFQGINLGEVPDEVKTAMSQDAQAANGDVAAAAAAAAGADSSSEPWISSPAMIAKGKEVYRANCAVCHGDSGKGDGPAGAAIGARDLVEGKWKVGGDAISLFKSITDGISGTSMAAFPQIDLQDRWAIVHFIHSITKNKGKDDPKALEAFASSAK